MALSEQFRRYFSARVTERPVPAAQYEHDLVTPEDLLLLGLAETTALSTDDESPPRHSAENPRLGGWPQHAEDCIGSIPGIDPGGDNANELACIEGGEAAGAQHLIGGLGSPQQDVPQEGGSISSPLASADSDAERSSDPESPDFAPSWGGSFASEDDDFPESRSDHLEALWHVEVPEADETAATEYLSSDVSRVCAEERATQFALAFLESADACTRQNLDLLVDIILDRGWSAVQVQVRALVRAGYDIPQIHLMFQLTSVWLHYMESDSLAPEQWHGGARLTWLEAARLLDYIGYEAEIEQVADFLSEEREIWGQLRRPTGQLATFKNYLFRYRLCDRTQVDDGIWQLNLDPNDSRSFDGTRNSLYSADWWDEPTDCGNAEITRIGGRDCDPARIADWLWPDSETIFDR